MRTKSAYLLWLVLPPILGLACKSSPPTSPPDTDAPSIGAGAPVISMSPRAPLPIFVGSTQRLSAQTQGARGRVLWQSSNPEVAAVDSTGVVHGISPGTTTIIAAVTTANGTTETASAEVAVRSHMLNDSSASRRHGRSR